MTGTPESSSPRFADALVAAVSRVGSPLCVGLDPIVDRIPAGAGGATPGETITRFCLGVLDAIAGVAGVVKPQSACFERYGPEGVAALHVVCRAARDRGLVVILDAKRGDIASTAEHYAAAVALTGAHGVTLSGYLGPESVRAYLDAGLGVFVLVRTSNADSDVVQSRRLDDGLSVAEMMADMTAELGREFVGKTGLSDVGAVVGATKASDGAGLRARMPGQIFLVPGVGAQGGRIEDLVGMKRRGGAGMIVNSSRSILYPPPSTDWQGAVRAAARATADELRGVLGSGL